jgi:hypothetical protein
MMKYLFVLVLLAASAEARQKTVTVERSSGVCLEILSTMVECNERTTDWGVIDWGTVKPLASWDVVDQPAGCWYDSTPQAADESTRLFYNKIGTAPCTDKSKYYMYDSYFIFKRRRKKVCD